MLQFVVHVRYFVENVALQNEYANDFLSWNAISAVSSWPSNTWWGRALRYDHIFSFTNSRGNDSMPLCSTEKSFIDLSNKKLEYLNTELKSVYFRGK